MINMHQPRQLLPFMDTYIYIYMNIYKCILHVHIHVTIQRAWQLPIREAETIKDPKK